METTILNDIAEDMNERAQMYALLSRLFLKEIDDELFATLKKEPPFSADDEQLAKGINLIRGYLDSDEASTLDLARDYAKAFCGASSTHKTSAYPFESVYTSEDGILMQEARDDMLRWYRKYGLGKSDDFHDCEDHIGLELEFYAYLINVFSSALKEGDNDRAIRILRDQDTFMHEHLINWIPEFDHHVQMRARTDFYRGAGKLLLDYVRRDCDALDDLIARLPETTEEQDE